MIFVRFSAPIVTLSRLSFSIELGHFPTVGWAPAVAAERQRLVVAVPSTEQSMCLAGHAELALAAGLLGPVELLVETLECCAVSAGRAVHCPN